MSFLKCSIAVFASVVLVGFISCGGDNDEESDGGAGATRLALENSVLPLGGSQIVSVEFSFSSDDVFDDDRHVLVAVRIPSTASFRNGTAEVQRPVDDNDVAPEVIVCEDATYLRFDLDENELVDAENPSGDGDAEIRFTIDAVARGASGVLAASAQNDSIGITCEAGFPADRTASLDVV